MSRSDLPHAVCVFLQLLSLAAVCLGRVDVAVYCMLQAVYLQLVAANMKD